MFNEEFVDFEEKFEKIGLICRDNGVIAEVNTLPLHSGKNRRLRESLAFYLLKMAFEGSPANPDQRTVVVGPSPLGAMMAVAAVHAYNNDKRRSRAIEFGTFKGSPDRGFSWGGRENKGPFIGNQTQVIWMDAVLDSKGTLGGTLQLIKAVPHISIAVAVNLIPAKTASDLNVDHLFYITE